MVERSCGQVVESFGYNEHNGRLEETRRSCQRRPTKFTYAKPNSQRVSEYYGEELETNPPGPALPLSHKSCTFWEEGDVFPFM